MRTRRRERERAPSDAVTTITSARRTLEQDVGRRTSRYLLSMSIRTVCLILAVVVEGPLRWGFMAGAIVLPYVAVVMANAGREREEPPDTLIDPRAITRGPADRGRE